MTDSSSTRRGFLLTLAGGAGSLLLGCSREDIRQAALKLIPPETLREMGLQTWERIRDQFPSSRKAALQRRLQGIGTRVVRAAQDQPEVWEFTVFQGDQINAFAVPGEKVGFFEGMFAAAKKDAQIGALWTHMMALSQSRPQPPAILSTHPSDEKRIEALRQVLGETGKG